MKLSNGKPAWRTYETFAIVHRKVATNRVMQVALKASYKILPSLEQQATYARILDMAKKTPNTFGINQEVSDVLKEAGLNTTAKDKTKKACQKASGLSTSQQQVHLVSEPKAAAMYALHGLDPHGLKVGDTTVVVGAGGGTVNLISYTITSFKLARTRRSARKRQNGYVGLLYNNFQIEGVEPPENPVPPTDTFIDSE
ncbi:unnamed protein product [Fusarium equiseti]|uniref:Uncharacterized protein n=1 Tax=Fusarium equiseti TaxID=61235 RepID=A0A8J2JC32_FUSEQ|nr:unnamed protein product [Fusarium equiseti]